MDFYKVKEMLLITPNYLVPFFAILPRKPNTLRSDRHQECRAIKLILIYICPQWQTQIY